MFVLLTGLVLMGLVLRMASFGREALETVGGSIGLSVDGRPEMKTAGVTIDWDTVPAVSADTVYEDGVTVLNGDKALRYGQVIVLIGVAEVQTVEFTGGPTGGSAVLTLPAAGNDAAESTSALAYNASAAAVLAALQALSRLGPNGVTSVTRAGAGSAGDPYIYTVTFNRLLGNVPALTATNTFTGGTTPTVTIATSTSGTTSGGKYGPYDSAATDGRATIERDHTFLVERTVQKKDAHSDHPPALEGGRVWKDRLIATNGSASLAAGPTLTNLKTAMPRLVVVD